MNIYMLILIILLIIIIAQNVSIKKYLNFSKKSSQEIKQQDIMPIENKSINTDANINQIKTCSPNEDIMGIQTITLQQDNSKIVFSKLNTKDVKLKDYVIIPTSTSALTGAATQLSPLLVQASKAGLFEASVPASALTQFTDKSFSTMIQGADGKIIGHAGFNSAITKVATPLVVFQIVAFITGQYYLNIINKNFQQVFSKMDTVKRFLKHDKIAELENIQFQLQRIIQIEHPQLEQLELLEIINNEVGHLVRYYINEVKHLGQKHNIQKSMFVKKQLEILNQNLSEEDFCFNMQMLANSEEIQQITKVITLMVNSKYITENPTISRKQYMQEIMMQIMNWKSDFSFINREGKKIIINYYNNIAEVANQVNPWTKSREKELNIFKMKVGNLKKEILSFGKFDFITKFQTETNNTFNKNERILLLETDNEGPVFLVKKPTSNK